MHPAHLSRSLAIVCLCLAVPFTLSGQGVGINPTGQPPHPGAMLDVNAPNKGLLVPRTQSASVTNPAAGMIVYDTVDMQLELYNGMQWLPMMTGGASSFWWADADGDGFGDPFNVIYAPTAPPFFVANSDDCNDASAAAHPGETEICDGIDNDCDGMIDEPTTMTCLIMGNCYSAGQLNPENGCEVCDPSSNNTGWTPITCPAGQICCGGNCVDPETDPNHCGACGITCDDGIPCTIDACTSGVCQHEVEPGMCVINGTCYAEGTMNPLNDCQVCNPSQNNSGWSELQCAAGESCCSGECTDLTTDVNNCGDCGIICNDGLACTQDVCVNGVCSTVILPGHCLIAGVCYEEGAQNPNQPCEFCVTATSQTSWTCQPGVSCASGQVCNASCQCQ